MPVRGLRQTPALAAVDSGPLEAVERLVAAAPLERLPAIVGDLARLSALAQGRIVRESVPVAAQDDRVVGVEYAAAKMERDSSWIYRNLDLLAFARVNLGKGRVAFSAARLDRFYEYLKAP